MAIIQTKYSVGDVVWRADTGTTKKQHPCPDCLGSRKWKVTSPAGTDYEFSCPRCSQAYQNNDALSLAYAVHVPEVKRLTIGQIRAVEGGDGEVRYMCRETGIGSGTLHSEADLYPSEAEALAAAEILAKSRDESTEWMKKLYDKSLRVCDYELHNAVKKAAEDAEISRGVRFQMLCEDLRDCQSNAEIQEALDRYSERVKELAA